MWLYFNKDGKLLRQLEHGNIARVGTTNFKIFCYFEGKNIKDIYTVARIKLQRPDLTESSLAEFLFIEPVDKVFLPDQTDGDYHPFVKGKVYTGYEFNFANFINGVDLTDQIILDTPGLWKATITLENQEVHDEVVGEVIFNVEEAPYSEDPTEIGMEEYYRHLLAVLRKRVPFKSTIYLRVIPNIHDFVNNPINQNIFNIGDILFDKNASYDEHGNVRYDVREDGYKFYQIIDFNNDPKVEEIKIEPDDFLSTIEKSGFTYTITDNKGEKYNIHSFNGLKKIVKKKDFLYEIEALYLDYEFANEQLAERYLDGACSSVRKGNFYGRNFDFYYNDSCSYVVRVPKILNRHASIGIANSKYNPDVNTDLEGIELKLTPFLMLDGINDAGLIASINIVSDNLGNNTHIYTAQVEERDKILATMLVRYILDYFDDARTACEYIRDYVTVEMPKLMGAYQEMHFMVADKTKTYLIEFIGDHAEVRDYVDIGIHPILTNFYIHNVNFNADYSVTIDNDNRVVPTSNITLHGQGLERYNNINTLYSTLNSKVDFKFLLENVLLYTQMYTLASSNITWKTEFAGLEDGATHQIYTITQNPNDAYFVSFVGRVKDIYNNRQRENPITWQTIHSVVYDFTNLTLSVRVQEEGNWLDYALSDSATTEVVPNPVGTPAGDLTTLGINGIIWRIAGGSGGSVEWNDILNKPNFKPVATSGSYLDLIDKPSIPTKTSELTNDVGFITIAALDTYATLDYVRNWHDNTKANITDIPHNTSDLTNDSGFINNTVNNLLNYYLKSETYTKDEVNSLIDVISRFEVVVVTTLPEPSEATYNERKIYLYKPSGATTYEEYVIAKDGTNYIREKIGDTDIRLTNYFTKDEINALLNGKQDTATLEADVLSLGFIKSVDLSAYRTATNQDLIDANKVDKTQKVNNKALSGDIELNANDIKANDTTTIQENIERIDERIDDLPNNTDFTDLNTTSKKIIGAINETKTRLVSLVKDETNKEITITDDLGNDYVFNYGGGDIPDNLVTTDTAQTITGAKTFSNGVKIGNQTYNGLTITTNTSHIVTIPDVTATLATVAQLDFKQDLLRDSGANQNIKTINGQTILGTGDLTISVDPPENMVTTDTEQTISGIKTFSNATTIKGLNFNGNVLTYDGKFYFLPSVGGVLATEDYVVANPVGTASTPLSKITIGTDTYSIPSLDGYATITYVDNLTNALDTRVTANETAITGLENNKQDKSTLDTDITALGYIKSVTWTDVLNKPTFSDVATSGDYDDLINKPDIPTKVSDLTNDSGFIDNLVDNLTNYYLKTETYNKTEVNSLIDAIKQLEVVVVTTLPTPSETTYNERKIYLYKPTGASVHEEYVIAKNTDDTYILEKIGDTDIKLTNYYTKTETDDLLDDKVDTTTLTNYYLKTEVDDLFDDYYTKNEIDTSLSGKQSTATLDTDVGNLGYIKTSALDDYALKSYVDNADTNLQTQITTLDTSKQDKATLDTDVSALGYIKSSALTNYATTTYVDNLTDSLDARVETIEDSLSGYQPIATLDNDISALGYIKTVDLSNYYIKSEVDGLINGVKTRLVSVSKDTTNQTITITDDLGTTTTFEYGSGGGGTDDYDDLINQPKVNNVTLIGNKTPNDLKIADYVETTYANLVTLRTNSQLVKGTQYRITDYATIIYSNTDVQSAGHNFDIIVVADSESVLNENARAIQHTGDTYFANNKLNAWKLKYSLDNDTTRFAWANASGKGVIYEMIDEFNNKCPYDFKNIQFKRYKLTATTTVATDLVNTYSGYKSITLASLYPSGFTIDTNDFVWRFTFDNGSGVDYSLSSGCYENEIKEYLLTSLQLNNITFSGTNNYGNVFGVACRNSSFGNCYSNTFGNNCTNNTFGNNLQSNTFGNNLQSNTFGNSCACNIFGNNCSSNIFGNNCTNNTFGNGCFFNILGDSCQNNAFMNNIANRTLASITTLNTYMRKSPIIG